MVGRGSRLAGLGEEGACQPDGLAASLPSTPAARRQPSLVKRCHLLLLGVIPLYEFWAVFSCQI